MRKKIITLLAQILVTIIVAILLIMLAGADPVSSLKQFVYGIFGNWNGFAEVMVKATPLIFLGLGISVAFSTGFFNIGAEGQFYVGAFVATIVATCLPAPGWIRIIVAFVLAFIAGGIWAFIPALLKNALGISETVNTIMFNYIAIMVVGIAIRGFLQDPAAFVAQSAKIELDARLPMLLPPTRLHLGFIIAVIFAIVMWYIANRTTTGFELAMCGLNSRAAYCIGLPVTRSLMLTAILSGGLAGIAGTSELLGVQYRLLEGLSSGNGYTAILIALLARNKPIRVVIVSLLFAMLQVGAGTMQRQMAIPESLVSMLTGFIVLMVLSKDLLDIRRKTKLDKKMGRDKSC